MRSLRCLLCGLLLVGCVGGEGGAGESLVGDWFVCMDAACTEIDNNGLRFHADRTWRELDGDDQVVTSAPICVELDDDQGEYSWDGEVLTLTFRGGSMIATASLDGDRLMLMTDKPEPVLMRKVKTFESLNCPSSDSPPLPLEGDSSEDAIPLGDAGVQQ